MPTHVQVVLEDGELAALKLLSVARKQSVARIVKQAITEHVRGRKGAPVSATRVELSKDESAALEVAAVQAEVDRYLGMAEKVRPKPRRS